MRFAKGFDHDGFSASCWPDYHRRMPRHHYFVQLNYFIDLLNWNIIVKNKNWDSSNFIFSIAWFQRLLLINLEFLPKSQLHFPQNNYQKEEARQKVRIRLDCNEKQLQYSIKAILFRVMYLIFRK